MVDGVCPSAGVRYAFVIFLALVPGLLLAVAFLRAQQWREPATRHITMALAALVVASVCTIPCVASAIDRWGSRHLGWSAVAEFTSHIAAVVACGVMIEWVLVTSRRKRLAGRFRAGAAAAILTLTILFAAFHLQDAERSGILAAGTVASRWYTLVYAMAVVYSSGHLVYLTSDAIRRRADSYGVCAALCFGGGTGIVYGTGILVCGMMPAPAAWITTWTWLTAGPSLLGLAIAGSVGWLPWAASAPGGAVRRRAPGAPARCDIAIDLHHIEVTLGGEDTGTAASAAAEPTGEAAAAQENSPARRSDRKDSAIQPDRIDF